MFFIVFYLSLDDGIIFNVLYNVLYLFLFYKIDGIKGVRVV